jgi:hypothetical protein
MSAMPWTSRNGSLLSEFFLDNHLSPKIARALNHLLAPDHSAHHLKDEFAPNTPDVVDFWYPFREL